MQQQESTSSFDGTVEAAVVEMDAAAVSTETTNVTSNHSDEDMEETRRRRGGGLVAQQNGRAGNDATIKRSSSLTLRSSNHANSQGDKPEWTDNE